MKYIDLFAGCGGLSLGLERAGFELALSVEKSEMACETFYHNFIKPLNNKAEWLQFAQKPIDYQFKHKLVTKELKAILDRPDLMLQLKDMHIDLVAGGPPCQGFSLAGRRNPDDARNQLPWQFLEFVNIVRPKAVIIENVVGISRAFKKNAKEAPFEQLQTALREIGGGYIVQPVHVNAMHFGVPEHRPRLMILGLRKDIADKLDIENTQNLWYSDFLDKIKSGTIPALAPIPTLKADDVRTVKDALYDLAGVESMLPTKSGQKFLEEMQNAKLWHLKPLENANIPNQSNRNHQEKAKLRFRLYQYLKEQNLASNTLNLPAIHSESIAREMLNELLGDCSYPAIAPDGTILSKDKAGLINLVFELKTKKHSQRSLAWDKPSPTVVTLPDDYVHPSEPRIFTVRELARFQSFPDAFEFKSKETTGSERRRFEVPQYSQVGNAVAPLLAYAVGRKFKAILQNYETTERAGDKKDRAINFT